MKNYYNEWKFKHPYPEDLKASLEKNAGRGFIWLFEGLLQSDNKTDYAIRSLKKKMQMAVNSFWRIMAKLAARLKSQLGLRIVFILKIGFPDLKGNEVAFSQSELDKNQLDRELRSTDLYPSNNTYRPNRLFQNVIQSDYHYYPWWKNHRII